MMFIEALDYSITIEQFGTETANFFAEHPIYGTVGYPTYEDALHDMHGILGIGQFLDSVDSLIEMGLVGDHYVFNAENMITEIVNECEGWDWTPETGIAPWESSEPEPEPDHSIRPNRKQRRADRRVQNKRHKKSDRLHGKGVFSYEYKENGILKTQILPDNMRSKSAWSKACHEWGDPDGLKGRVPRTQSINVHKDTKPVPEQEPWYVGVYGTLEVCKGVTVTMEWPVPEAVQGEPV